ncbi:MAG: FG-GAP repeat domain-containing protein [Bryobacteraceae bacterium]
MPPLEQVQYRFRSGHPVHYPRPPKPASVCTRAVFPNLGANTTTRPIAIGDIDADGDADIVWWNGSTVTSWDLTSGMYHASHTPTNAPSGYSPVASGDFNGDGNVDVVFQNASGAVQIGYTGANYTMSWSSIGTYVPVIGAGDYDNNNLSDLLLRATNKTLYIALNNNGTVGAAQYFNSPYNHGGTSGNNELDAWQTPCNGAPVPLSH